MSLDKINPFATSPMKSGFDPGRFSIGQQKPETQGPGAENQMYGFKGKQFDGFSVPQANQGNSFLGQGALGDQALYGANDARLGGKLNVIA